MATFIPGMTDKFPEMDLYKPDYAFLTQVYGTKQGEYDRGFKYVKSIINSALNNPITSKDNEEYRNQVFKKIQSSLKDVTNTDLSNPTNIQQANSIVDPIVKDKELAYDMSYTKFMQTEREKYNGYKNSPDAKERAKANDFSAAYMNLSDTVMKSSKRGDGSILGVQPNKFVPFEDMNAFLDERAKADGLKIKYDVVDGFYIKTVVNGQGAIKPFEQWADDVVKSSGMFDDQLHVQGTVTAESEIQTEMKKSGIAREQAIQNIGTRLYEPVAEETNKDHTALQKANTDAADKVLLFEREHPTGIPESKKEYYDMLLKQKHESEQGLNVKQAEKDDLAKGKAGYVANNLASVYQKALFKQQTGSWAQGYATRNQELSIKENPVQLKIYEVETNKKLKIAEMSQQKELAYAKMANDKAIADDKLMLDMQKAKAKGEIPSSEIVNTYTPAGSGIPAVDLVNSAYQKNNNDLYTQTFDPEKGVVRMVFGEEKTGLVSSLMAKLKTKADGGNQTFSENDLDLLQQLGKKMGIKVINPQTQDAASAQLNSFEIALYKKAKEIVPQLKQQGTLGKYKEQIQQISAFEGTVETTLNQRKKLDQIQSRIAEVVLDANGNIKDAYKDNITYTGETLSGIPTFDLSKLTEAQKNGLKVYVGDEFSKSTTTPVVVRNNSGVTHAEWSNIFDAGNRDMSSNPGLFDRYATYGDPTKSKVFGNQYEVTADPNTRTLLITLRDNQENANGKKTVTLQPLTVKIPFDRINSSPTLAGLKKYVSEVENKSTTLGMNFDKFRTDPNTTIEAPDYVKASGFDYSVSGVKNQDGYKLLYYMKHKNPATNTWTSSGVTTVPMAHEADLQSFLNVQSAINAQYELYQNLSKNYEDASNQNDKRHPYKK